MSLHVKRGEAVVIHGAVGRRRQPRAPVREDARRTCPGDGLRPGRYRVRAPARRRCRRRRTAGGPRGGSLAFAPGGVDAVLALSGGKPLTRLLDGVRHGGRVAFPNGVEPAPRKRRGLSLQSYDAAPGVRELNAWDGLSRRATQVPIAAAYPLAQAAKAHARLAKAPRARQDRVARARPVARSGPAARHLEPTLGVAPRVRAQRSGRNSGKGTQIGRLRVAGAAQAAAQAGACLARTRWR